MASTGTILAKNFAIYHNASPDVAISCQTNAELQLSTETFDVTCKDSGAWAAPRPGTKSWTMSGEALLAFDATYGFQDLFDLWSGQTLASFLISTGTSGDTYFYGDGYITDLSLSSQGNDAGVTFTYTFTGTGAITRTTVS
jgi:predicted secreted protein